MAGAIALGILPLYLAELNVMAHMSMYQFFPFVFVFVGGVGWTRWRAAAGTAGPRLGKGWWPETVCVGAGLLLLAVHAGLFGPWLGGAAGIVMAAAGVLALRRVRDVQLWDLWLLLAITMRLPLELDGRLAGVLQRASSRLSSLVLDGLGVLHLLSGNVVMLPHRKLFVDEACSGIISVMSVIACAAMLAIWRGRATLHFVLLVALGVGSAMIMNVVRISAIAAALAWYDVDWTSGWQHETISLVAFLGTFVLLVGFDHALVALTAPVPSETGVAREWAGVRWAARTWNKLVSVHWFKQPAYGRGRTAVAEPRATGIAGDVARPPWIRFAIFSALALALGVFHSVAIYANYLSATEDADHVVERITKLDRSGLAKAISPWQIVDEAFVERETISELAPFSKVYKVKNPETQTEATVSLDYPFYRRWHDVCGCYLNTGWRQDWKTVVREGAETKAGECQFIKAQLEGQDGGHGYLVFANINQDGVLVAPPRDLGDLGYLLNTFVNKAQHSRQVSLNPKKLFQVQVWHQQAGLHGEEQAAELEGLFYKAFDYLKVELRNGAGI
jgi:exosortase